MRYIARNAPTQAIGQKGGTAQRSTLPSASLQPKRREKRAQKRGIQIKKCKFAHAMLILKKSV
ncbi:MAG: hypothetical protein KBS47_03545 [Bacteroidales bacterium]|nr:hypothetical protein [Candidatus Equimonas enterica]